MFYIIMCFIFMSYSSLVVTQSNKPLAGKAKTDQWCIHNLQNYRSSCNGQFPDGSRTQFCNQFSERCYSEKQNEPVPDQTPVASGGHNGSTLIGPNQHYCSMFGKDYYNMCVNQSVQADAAEFCEGYKKMCPGVPMPGSQST